MSFYAESDLPGIGKKITLSTHSKEKATLIIHHDGKREFYIMDPDGEQVAGITLLDEEARRIGSILSGIVFKPKLVSDLEKALSGIRIDWFQIEKDSPAVGNTLKKLAIRQLTQISIIAILKDDSTFIPSPDANYSLCAGDTCVVIGTPENFVRFGSLIRN